MGLAGRFGVSPNTWRHTDMALNHLNLTVPDVPETRAFFETYFGFRCVAEPESGVIVLVDESGFVLTLNNFDKAAEVAYPGAFHVGFRQDSREKVDAIYQRLKADGFNMKPPHEFHGGWTFYCRAPGGFLVEVFHQAGGERGGDGESFEQATGAEEELAGQARR
jgi:catechol 2,3-dioxygenase-like lactoylglutathione lyase family enzyme